MLNLDLDKLVMYARADIKHIPQKRSVRFHSLYS